jgi:uncharacterized alkaline shock family protein YloU
MALFTSNLYGNVVVTRRALRAVAGISALECYGVWGVGKSNTIKNVEGNFLPKNGVRIWTVGNKIGVYIDIIANFGVGLDTLVSNLRKSIRYKLENFSGMSVEFVDIRVMSIRSNKK